ncbi:hypothetical protein CBS101457_006728 [Exobasidium rhododendri]|nr:hypothetical protein CBS101457_006728 [Exobasidium rhododendri]
MVAQTRRRTAGTELAPKVEPCRKVSVRCSLAKDAHTVGSSSTSRDSHTRLQEDGGSDTGKNPTVDVLTSSPAISRPPSSIFDDENDFIKGWASGSSHTTEHSLPSRRGGKRKVMKEGSMRDRSFDEADISPTLEIHSRQMKGKLATQDDAQVIIKRSPKRTRSDPTIRAATPPSVKHGEPNRPQSAMKHKSANKYSSRKDDPAMILITSHTQLPKRESSYDDDHLSAKKKVANVKFIADGDPDAFSPHQSARKVKIAKYVLCARASLPKSDFYERVKEEEGSPTPETRRKDSSVS